MIAREEQRRPPRVRQLLEPLLRRGVDFVLVGGMAGTLHGSSLPSFDVDVAYSRDPANLERLANALRDLRVRLRGAPPDLPFIVDARTLHNGANFTFLTPFGDLDVLADIDGIKNYEQLRARSRLVEAYGLGFRIAAIDDLIAMKRAADRPKDQLMLEEYIVIADEQADEGRQSS
jgi:hypothetical protein